MTEILTSENILRHHNNKDTTTGQNCSRDKQLLDSYVLLR